MRLFKEVSAGKVPATNRDKLRQKRLAHEQAQKEAGIWGDMTVAQIIRDNKVFLHYSKAHGIAELSALAGKRPREMTALEHVALVAWLKSGAYAGFTQKLVAWNVSEAEALRVKDEHIALHRSNGLEVVNPM